MTKYKKNKYKFTVYFSFKIIKILFKNEIKHFKTLETKSLSSKYPVGIVWQPSCQ